MEERKQVSHVSAGLIIAGLLVVYSLIIQFTGLMQNRAVGLLQYLVIFGGLIYFINQYGKANNFTISFGNLFAYGFKSTAVFTILNIAFLIILFVAFPDLKEKTFDIARQQMEENPKVSESDVDKAIDIARRFFWVGLVGGTMLLYIILGAIGSLIGAAVTKKRPHNPIDQLSV
ncbi:MAG TPA: DUF4199 domain-containing protein [Flavisolibacter sp.]|nr:DUF4199 domain-containing protein [Flavisolibacter sp.]